MKHRSLTTLSLSLSILAAALTLGGCDAPDDESFLLDDEAAEDAAEFRAGWIELNTEVRMGKHKVKITNTTAEKWKLKWKCLDDDYQIHSHIDSDTYPSSTGKTRETSINDRCPDGKWAIEMETKWLGNWKRVAPYGSGICGDANYSCGYRRGPGEDFHTVIPNGHFNNDDKICLKAWHVGSNHWLEKVGC